MIEAKELNLGNWVKDNDGEVIQVSFKTFELMNDLDTYYIDAIPLTEEILLKAGFEKKNSTYCLKVHDLTFFKYYMETLFDNSNFYVYTSVVRHLPKGGEEIRTEKQKLSINNLHQLQNIYFALVGKELEIKL